MYSISTTKLPSLEKPKVPVTERAPLLTDDSELLNGGLAGLQNLGNTVKFFTRCPFARFQPFALLVLHEFSPSMSVEHQTIAVVLFKQQSERPSEYFVDQCDERSFDARSVKWTTHRWIDSFLLVEYASLIRKMWSDNRSMVSPLSFKNTIGKFAPRFTGYS